MKSIEEVLKTVRSTKQSDHKDPLRQLAYEIGSLGNLAVNIENYAKDDVFKLETPFEQRVTFGKFVYMADYILRKTKDFDMDDNSEFNSEYLKVSANLGLNYNDGGLFNNKYETQFLKYAVMVSDKSKKETAMGTIHALGKARDSYYEDKYSFKPLHIRSVYKDFGLQIKDFSEKSRDSHCFKGWSEMDISSTLHRNKVDFLNEVAIEVALVTELRSRHHDLYGPFSDREPDPYLQKFFKL